MDVPFAIMASIKKEIFICDQCGLRKRLSTAQRHWCEQCDRGSPVEMRPARDKRVPAVSSEAAQSRN
jgi:hypothetical protein